MLFAEDPPRPCSSPCAHGRCARTANIEYLLDHEPAGTARPHRTDHGRRYKVEFDWRIGDQRYYVPTLPPRGGDGMGAEGGRRGGRATARALARRRIAPAAGQNHGGDRACPKRQPTLATESLPPRTMAAARLVEPHRIEVEDSSVPDPGPTEVRVKIEGAACAPRTSRLRGPRLV